MSSKDQLKRAVCEAIDRHADAIIDLGDTILRNPETGFNEVKTAALSPGIWAPWGWRRTPVWR